MTILAHESTHYYLQILANNVNLSTPDKLGSNINPSSEIQQTMLESEDHLFMKVIKKVAG